MECGGAVMKRNAFTKPLAGAGTLLVWSPHGILLLKNLFSHRRRGDGTALT